MDKKASKELLAKIRKLPPLSLVVQKLVALCNDDRCSASEVTRVLSSDQVVAGKVLELVNSSFYGFTRKIGTISEAVVLLGNQNIKNLAMAFALSDVFLKLGHSSVNDAIWRHAVTVATASQHLGVAKGCPDPEAAFVAGLLHDIGQLLLSGMYPGIYATIEVALHDGKLVQDLERDAIGVTHTEAGAALLEYWRLPPGMCELTRIHHDEKKLMEGSNPVSLLFAASEVLAKVMGNSGFDPPCSESDSVRIQKLGLDPACYGPLLRRIRQSCQILIQQLGLPETVFYGSLVTDGGEAKGNILLLSMDRARMGWVRSLLSFFGWNPQPILPEKMLLESSPVSNVQFCLIDPMGQDKKNLYTLYLKMKKAELPFAFLENGCGKDTETKAIQGFPELPFAFSAGQIDALVFPKQT